MELLTPGEFKIKWSWGRIGAGTNHLKHFSKFIGAFLRVRIASQSKSARREIERSLPDKMQRAVLMFRASNSPARLALQG